MKAFVPAVAYLRASSTGQELSVEQQRNEVRRFAEHKGYKIIREYVDEGLSGSKEIKKRKAFAEMIADSSDRKFKVILCYDAARFTRMDSIDSSPYKAILRTNGVYLDTVKEGDFDWTTEVGRMKDLMFCEANRRHSLNVSKDSLRGRADVARLGWWPHAEVPFGYDKVYHEGGTVQRLPRTSKKSKGKHSHIKLVVNEHEAAVIRFMFQYIHDGGSVRGLVAELAKRKIKGTDGRTWGKNAVLWRLRDMTYMGTVVIGQRAERNDYKEKFNRAEYMEFPKGCPAIIDPALFASVQAIFEKNVEEKRKAQPGRAGIMSGLCVCGNCGFRMVKRVLRGVTWYVCSSGSLRPWTGCRQWKVREDEEVPFLVQWLVETVDETLMKSLTDGPAKADVPELAILKKQVDALEARLKNAIESAGEAPQSMRKAAWANAEKIQEELSVTKERLAVLERVTAPDQLEELRKWFDEVRPKMVRIERFVSEHSHGGLYPRMYKMEEDYVSPDQLRGFMTRLGVQVTYTFGENPDKAYHLPRHIPVSRRIEGYFVAAATRGEAGGTRRAEGCW